MTIKEKIINYLETLIYFEEDVKQIWNKIDKNEDIFPCMARRWNDPIADYPAYIMVVIMMSVDSICLEWIYENKPNHFLKPYFENQVKGIPIPEVKNEKRNMD